MSKAESQELLLSQAISLQQNGQITEAITLCRQILEQTPEHSGALNFLGITLTQSGKLEEAALSIEKALKAAPGNTDIHFHLATVLQALNRHNEAVKHFDRVLALKPGDVVTHMNIGNSLHALNRHGEATERYKKVLALQPNYPEAYFSLGNALVALRRHNDAFAAYDKALTLKPELAEAWHGSGDIFGDLKPDDIAVVWLCRGNVFGKLKRFDEAFAAFDKALTLKPDLAEAWHGRGNLLYGLKRYEEAFSAYDRARTLKPTLVGAWLGSGNVLYDLKRYEKAVAAYDEALILKPDLAEAWHRRGNVLYGLNRYSEALAAYDKELTLNPGYVGVWLGRGNVLFDLKRYEEALTAFDKAMTLKPDLAEVWLGRGNVFYELKRFDEALAAYDKALMINPNLAGVWANRGNVFFDLKRYKEAIAAYDQALILKPDLAGAWLGRGNVFCGLKRYEEAIAAFDRVLALRPDLEYLHGERLHAKMQSCDWRDLEYDWSNILEKLRKGACVSSPYIILALPSSSADQLSCAKLFLEKNVSATNNNSLDRCSSNGRIRIAYLSADFQEHAVMKLMAGLFEHHDKSRFETIAISFGLNDGSAMRTRVVKAFDQFLDVRSYSDQEIANTLREIKTNIAIDLTGFTKNMRVNILASRPAPVQVNYLGYAGTMGADFIDYIIADKIVIPIDQQQYYSEKVAYLPDSYLASDATHRVSEAMPTRKEAGLPDNGFVFCSFIDSYKITPDVFSIWMRLLHQVPGSVLWLTEGNSSSPNHLKLEAQRRGISSERLAFAPRIKFEDYLARHRLADLFLDTLYFNAHTTASHALWAGLPVLTCLGATFAGRVAASLLVAVGLPELVTKSLEEYEALALKLACDPALLASIKSKLARNRDTYPLFNTARFTRHIEAAYINMWEKYQRGELPESFIINSIRQ